MTTTFHIATVDVCGRRQSRTRTADDLPSHKAFLKVIAELSGRALKTLECLSAGEGLEAFADDKVVGTLILFPSGNTVLTPSFGRAHLMAMC